MTIGHATGFMAENVIGNLFDGLFGGTAESRSPPKPARLTYMIGDIHGHAELLERIVTRIETDQASEEADWVFLGDYVDRGPESDRVLEMLRALETRPNVTCLMGNHDRKLLDFVNFPLQGAERWFDYGGTETLESFGLNDQPRTYSEQQLLDLSARLRAALPDGLEDWLKARPLLWKSGTVVGVHAMTDPYKPLDSQDENTLLWARPNSSTPARRDGNWVVHGHTIVPEMQVLNGRINVDTGAFHSGRLTAARITPDGEIKALSVGKRH